jgi:hypothetical protein
MRANGRESDKTDDSTEHAPNALVHCAQSRARDRARTGGGDDKETLTMAGDAVTTASADTDKPIGYWLEADDVVRSGHYLRGIDVLTEANRRERSAQREERLVELRHLAVPEAAALPGRAEWPPPYPDPFPNGGMPEIDAAQLTTELMGGSLTHHGCLVVRRLIDPPGVDRLVHTIDSALAAVAAKRKRKATPETEAWFTPFVGRAPIWGQGDEWVRVVDSPRGTFEVTEVFQDIGRTKITEYLGQRPVMGSYKWTLRRITPACIGEWHQDGRVLGPDLRVVNVWVALTRCGGDSLAPGLEFLPGRTDEYLSVGVEGASVHFSIADHFVEERGLQAFNPVFEPGDALLLNEWTPHRTGSREGLTDARHAIEAWFFSPTACPDDQLSFVF